MAQRRPGTHRRPTVQQRQHSNLPLVGIAALLAVVVLGGLAWGAGIWGNQPGQPDAQQGNAIAAGAAAGAGAGDTDAAAGGAASENSAEDAAAGGAGALDAAINDTPAADNAGGQASDPAAASTTGTSAKNAGTQTTDSQPPTQQDTWSLSFASTGDMIFGREVGTYVDAYGGAAPLANVADLLAAPDITIGNLEAPLSTNESAGLWEKDVLLISRPAAIEGLKNSDFTFLSLANNHSMDYGQPALADTIAALDGAGILHAGAGMNYNEAWAVAETTVKGVKVAFISFTDVIPENFLAYEESAGVAAARIDMDWACQVVRDAAASHDIVVVAAHWGIEYQDYADQYQQIDPAHQLVEAGASVVLGNHPHVIQGVEFYQGALITYSQGDFVFDHYSLETGETFILTFDFTDRGIQNVVATPVYLEDPYGIPGVVTGDAAAHILERLELISDGMNTTFDLRDDKAYITATDGNANPR